MRRLILLILFATAANSATLSVETLWKLHRVADPHVSPDGRTVAYSITTPDMAANTRPTQIWSVSIDGGTPRLLTREGTQNSRPRWSPDGRRIAFQSNRGGSTQIWTMAADGSDARQVTKISTEASGHIWSPDGKSLLFTSDVYPDCPDDACNAARDDQQSKSKVKAKHVKRLLYRHWTAWKDGKRSHLFLVAAEGGAARDITPGDFDTPPFSLGGPDDYAFSPDGREIAYASNHDLVEATSTNGDLFIVPTSGSSSSGTAKKITGNLAYDGSPAYSPDGRWIAYRAQTRPGNESDRFRLMLYERATGKLVNLTETYDRWVNSIAWSPDSKQLYFTAEDQATQAVMVIPVSGAVRSKGDLGLDGGQPKALVTGGVNDDVAIAGGRMLVFTRASMRRPVELYTAPTTGGEPRPLTRANDEILAGVELSTPEPFWFAGAGGTKVHGWLMKPPAFDASKKYPVMMVLHGGPQTGYNDSWSFRWNPQVFAAAGYVTVMINRRGSTGFGQKFIDEITQDWGGKAYQDLMKGLDHVLTTYRFTDGNRVGASGASYGGYMVNWIAGHTTRFKCLVSHAGLFDLRSMYGATEELWFPEWDFGGTPWEKPEVYARLSPSQYVKNFKTPMLVIHGDLDYRVPLGEGMQMFTALQKMNVPSEYLNFPDEGHWILKPQNSVLWYRTVIAWWDRWLKNNT